MTCTATRDRVEFTSGSLLRKTERHAFERSQFLIRGRLPAPAA